MNEQMTKIKARLENQIENANLQVDPKDRMKRILDAIFIAPNGRLYFERKPDYQEYLTLARNQFSGDYDFTIAKKMINEQSGSIEGRDYEFPSLSQLSAIIEEHKDVMESEIVNAQNSVRAQEPQNNEKSNKTPAEQYTENAKSIISAASNLPEYQKQRAYDVMNLLAEMPSAKIYVERGDNYSKAIALNQTKSGYGYHILTRMFDEYSGATLNRDDRPISAVSLVSYVNEHRVELDKEMKSIKAKMPVKKDTKTVDTGDER